MAVITGTNGNDQYPHELEGTERADQISGLAGDDSLIGFGGDDLLDGGAGADDLFGSANFDTASYQGSKAGVQVMLYAGSGLFGDAAGDQLYGIEGVTGSAYADGLAGDGHRVTIKRGAEARLGQVGDGEGHAHQPPVTRPPARPGQSVRDVGCVAAWRNPGRAEAAAGSGLTGRWVAGHLIERQHHRQQSAEPALPSTSHRW